MPQDGEAWIDVAIVVGVAGLVIILKAIGLL